MTVTFHIYLTTDYVYNNNHFFKYFGWMQFTRNTCTDVLLKNEQQYTTNYIITRMHSSRMRTARALTVSASMLCAGGVPGPGGCVPGPGGGYLVPGWVCTWSQGVYLVWGCTWSRGVPGLGGVPGPRDVPGPGVGVYLVLGGAPGPGGCTWSWGVYLVRGVPGLGAVRDLGVYLVPGGVPGPGGCTWSRGGGSTWSGGVPGLGGCT